MKYVRSVNYEQKSTSTVTNLVSFLAIIQDIKHPCHNASLHPVVHPRSTKSNTHRPYHPRLMFQKSCINFRSQWKHVRLIILPLPLTSYFAKSTPIHILNPSKFSYLSPIHFIFIHHHMSSLPRLSALTYLIDLSVPP